MSARGLLYSFDPAPNNPHCDICGMPTNEGAFLVHLERRPGIALFVQCPPCAVEISCVVVREYWPRAPPTDPPPDTPPASSGGGST